MATNKGDATNKGKRQKGNGRKSTTTSNGTDPGTIDSETGKPVELDENADLSSPDAEEPQVPEGWVSPVSSYLIPSGDIRFHEGKLYTRRQNSICAVWVEVKDVLPIKSLAPVPEFFVPRMPWADYLQVVAWHRAMVAKYRAETHISHLLKSDGSQIHVPFHQIVSRGAMTISVNYETPENRAILAELADDGVDTGAYHGTTHNHVTASAFASGTDDADEVHKQGFHLTVGNMDRTIITVHARYRAKFSPVFHPTTGDRLIPLSSVLLAVEDYGRFIEIPGWHESLPLAERVSLSKFWMTHPNDDGYPAEWDDFVTERVTTTGYRGTHNPGGTRPGPVGHGQADWYAQRYGNNNHVGGGARPPHHTQSGGPATGVIPKVVARQERQLRTGRELASTVSPPPLGTAVAELTEKETRIFETEISILEQAERQSLSRYDFSTLIRVLLSKSPVNEENMSLALEHSLLPSASHTLRLSATAHAAGQAMIDSEFNSGSFAPGKSTPSQALRFWEAFLADLKNNVTFEPKEGLTSERNRRLFALKARTVLEDPTA